MTEVVLVVGDRIKDNDPRMSHHRVLTVSQVLPNGVAAHTMGRVFCILRRRIHTDGKPRRSGFSLLPRADAGGGA